MYGQCDAIWNYGDLLSCRESLPFGTKLYCLMMEARVCKQLAQGCYNTQCLANLMTY